MIGSAVACAFVLAVVAVGVVRAVLLTFLCSVGVAVWAGARSRPHRDRNRRVAVEHVQPHTVIVQHLGESSRPAWR